MKPESFLYLIAHKTFGVKLKKREYKIAVIIFILIVSVLFLYHAHYNGAYILNKPAYVRNTGTTEPVYFGTLWEVISVAPRSCQEYYDFGVDPLKWGWIEAIQGTFGRQNGTGVWIQPEVKRNDLCFDYSVLEEAACGTSVDLSSNGITWRHTPGIAIVFWLNCKDTYGYAWSCQYSQCEKTCGNKKVDPGEECDGDHTGTCTGTCIPPDQKGACTCSSKGESFSTVEFSSNLGNDDLATNDRLDRLLIANYNVDVVDIYNLDYIPPKLIDTVNLQEYGAIFGVTFVAPQIKMYVTSFNVDKPDAGASVISIAQDGAQLKIPFGDATNKLTAFGDIVYSSADNTVYAVNRESNRLLIIQPNDESTTFLDLGGTNVHLSMSYDQDRLYVIQDAGEGKFNLLTYSLPDLQLMRKKAICDQCSRPITSLPEIVIDPSTNLVYISYIYYNTAARLETFDKDGFYKKIFFLDLGESGLAIDFRGRYLITGLYVRNLGDYTYTKLYTIPHGKADAYNHVISIYDKAFIINEATDTVSEITGFFT